MNNLTDVTVLDVIDEVHDTVEALINKCEKVGASIAGLDARCGTIFIGGDFIATTKGSKNNNLRYYGGFEYVDSECQHTLGDWVFYVTDDDRVDAAHERAMEWIEMNNSD
jgi:hypothetical protein